MQAQEAVLARTLRDPRLRRVWVVRVAPMPTHWPAPARVVPMATSKDECHARALAANRPTRWHALIDKWFA